MLKELREFLVMEVKREREREGGREKKVFCIK